MQDYQEANVSPVSFVERAGQYIKRNIAFLGLGIAGFALLLVFLGGLRSCEPAISVPDEWIRDYYSSYDEETGSGSYSFFANLIRSLTRDGVIPYELNELDFSPEEYDARRDEYLENEAGLNWEIVPVTGYNPVYIINKARMSIPLNDLELQAMKELLNDAVSKMNTYGVKSHTGLETPDYGQEIIPGFLNLLFHSYNHFKRDSELLLNVYHAPTLGMGGRFSLNSKPANARDNEIRLGLRGGGEGFNSDLLFKGATANAFKEVNSGNAYLGFYLKTKPEKIKPGLRDIDLSIGKVFMLWSPNVPRRELLWIYNNCVAPARLDYQRQNTSISLNRHWLPDQYPYVAEEVVSLLQTVDTEKALYAAKPAAGKEFKLYFDSNDVEKFVDILVRDSNGKLNLSKVRAISPEGIQDLLAKKPGEPIIYIYGIDLHSKYNPPVQLISRSFWYKGESASALRTDIQAIVDNFGSRITPAGQIDGREFSQYSDLERALCIGNSDSKSGLFPLFTIPYSMIYKESAISELAFNTTRGFLRLKLSRARTSRR